MNPNSLVNKQKQKQGNKQKKLSFNSLVKFIYLCRVTEIKIAWINTCYRITPVIIIIIRAIFLRRRKRKIITLFKIMLNAWVSFRI